VPRLNFFSLFDSYISQKEQVYITYQINHKTTHNFNVYTNSPYETPNEEEEYYRKLKMMERAIDNNFDDLKTNNMIRLKYNSEDHMVSDTMIKVYFISLHSVLANIGGYISCLKYVIFFFLA